MNTSKTFAQLKAAARNSLTGHLRSAVGAVLLYLATLVIMAGMPSSLAPDHNVLRPVFLLLVGFIVNTLLQMLGIGLRLRFLRLHFNQNPLPADMGTAFRGEADRAVRMCGHRAVLYTLCELPAFLFSMTLGQEPDFSRRLVYCLLLAAGNLVLCLLRLTYVCADYLFLEYPDLPPRELLQTSRRLISGNRLRLLAFHLSFLPLHLLALISFGLAEPFVLCYVYAGEAAFYEDLVRVRTGAAGSGA